MPLTYEDIKEPFLDTLRADKKATALINQIEAGKGTYEMASEYAARVGDDLAKVLRQRAPLESIAEWDVEEMIPKSLGLDHSIVTYACENVQKAMNADAGLGIKYIQPEFDSNRAYGIVEELLSNPEYINIEASFYDQLANFSQNVVDEAIRVNAEVISGAGVRSYVVRTAEAGACPWCEDLVGIYDYDEVRFPGDDVWRRHENCRCTIAFFTERNGILYREK